MSPRNDKTISTMFNKMYIVSYYVIYTKTLK